MREQNGTGTTPLSPLKQALLDHLDALPPHCQGPFLRLLMRIRNDYPAVKARALYAAEVAQARHAGRRS